MAFGLSRPCAAGPPPIWRRTSPKRCPWAPGRWALAARSRWTLWWEVYGTPWGWDRVRGHGLKLVLAQGAYSLKVLWPSEAALWAQLPVPFKSVIYMARIAGLRAKACVPGIWQRLWRRSRHFGSATPWGTGPFAVRRRWMKMTLRTLRRSLSETRAQKAEVERNLRLLGVFGVKHGSPSRYAVHIHL